MSHFCSACLVNWRPHHTGHGQCPMCGARTTAGPDPASDDAEMLFEIVSAEACKRETFGRGDLLFAQ